jgi:uncharacterized membrane protein YjdF
MIETEMSTEMNKRSKAVPKLIMGVTLSYLAIGTVAALRTDNWEFVFYILVVLGLGLSILLIHSRIGLTPSVLWLLSLWGLLHMAGGLIPIPDDWSHVSGKPVLYSWDVIPGYLRYDQIIHAFGFSVATWVCWQSLSQTLGARRQQTGMVALAVLAGLGLGATNEVVEFFATLFLDTNVGGYENTGWDLVSNTVGSLASGLCIRFWPKDP